MLVPKTRQESYDARHRRESRAYRNHPETRIIVVKDEFVTNQSHYERWRTFGTDLGSTVKNAVGR